MLEMLRNGGVEAYPPAFLGALGALIGMTAIITLIFSRRAARWVGCVALITSAATAGIGLAGMHFGLQATERGLVSVPVMSATTRERLRVEGFDEAQCAAKVGLVGSATSFVLGAIAAVAGAVSTRKSTIVIASLVIALVPLAIVARASVESSHAKYPFDPHDVTAWDLVDARASVDRDPREGCDDFDRALDEARQSSVDPTTFVPDWRAVATTCARNIFADVRAANGELTRPGRTPQNQPRMWNANALLDSPLLVDEDLRRQITVYAHTTAL